jgi:hypothetical protein
MFDSKMLIVMAVVFVILLLPLLWVLGSGRSHGGAKFGWFIAVLFFNWIAFAVFLITTQVPRKDDSQ